MLKEEREENPKQSKIPLYLSVLIIAGIVAGYFFIPEVKTFMDEAWAVLTSEDQQRIEEWVSGFGWLGPVVLIIAMTIQMFLIVIPSVFLMVVAILAYGPIWGSIIVLVGIFIASSVAYIIGKYFGELIVLKLIGKKTEKNVAGFLEKYGFGAVVVTRVNPLLSNDSISFVAGLLNMNYWKFISATLLGIIPLVTFISILGDNMDRLKNGLLYTSLISLVLFGIYVWWDKTHRDAD